MSTQSNSRPHTTVNNSKELEQLLNINTFADLFIAALNARKLLIENMRLTNSPLLEYAEQIQHDELKKISTVTQEWTTTQRPRKVSARKIGSVNVSGIPEVASFDEVGSTLSYVKPHDHYAIRLCGVLFHGNIGQLTESKLPEKIKNCRIRTCKIIGCPFYHDPVIYGGCERRNFIKNQDLILTSENIDRFTDRIMHDILSVLMYRYSN